MTKLFEVKDLVFTYPKQKAPTLKRISFDVEKGTIFGLLGPSGAGKSTTQKILTKLLSSYEGTILYNGVNLKEYHKEFYENIGVGFEMPVHFNKLSAMENLQYFAGLYKNQTDYEALLTRVGLFEARNQEVGDYSKGMKVRLNFVRAIIHDPDVIFLDEPTAGLDPNNAKIIKDMILEMKRKGKTIFITTHLMSDVEQLCDKVVFINNGINTLENTVRNLKLEYGKKEVKVEYYENKALSSTTFPLDNLAENQDFLETLKTKNVETIHSGETSLEEIFIKVTGELE